MINSKKNEHRGAVARQIRLEALERRELLDGAGTLFGESPHLTLSFSDDGADIGGAANRLTSFMNGQFANNNEWKDTILRAFQTWAVHTNANLGVVQEDGVHAFGVEGSRLRDPRFGDIRIGARPLAENVLAISIPHDTLVSGTWAGDVIFNSNGSYSSIDELFSVALHEAGHVFGLSHSDDHHSPMHFHGVSEAIVLTDADIATLQSLYGPRSHDKFDREMRNDSVASASFLDLTNVTEPGTAPSIAFADLGEADIDVYEIEIPEFYDGAISIRVRSRETSLLAPAVKVISGDGQVLADLEMTGTHGGLLIAELAGQDHREGLFVEVSSSVDDVFAVGGYSLAVVFDDINEVDVAVVEQLTGDLFAAIDDDDVDSFFQDEDDLFNDDEHSDDDFEFAEQIGEFDESDELRRFQIVASLAGPADVDYFELESPESMSDKGTMIASVRPLEPGGAVPNLALFNEDGHPMTTEVLVNDGRELLIQVPDVEADVEMFLSVSAPGDPPGVQIGNYELTVLFQKQSVELPIISAGVLSDADPRKSQTLNVNIPQLQHFALTAHGHPNGEVALIVHDANGEAITQFSAGNGRTVTGQSVLLMPGTYSIDASLVNAAIGDTNFEIKSTEISVPIGLVPVNPSELDFSCPGIDDTFCYPGGIQSDEPFLWDDFIHDFPAVPNLPPAEQVEILIGDWWTWYWNRIPGNNPPLTIEDVYTINNGTKLNVGFSQGVIANDVEPNGDVLLARISQGPMNGVVEMASDGSFSYTPNPGFTGTDSFTYVVSDSSFTSNSSMVTIEVSTPLPEGDFSGDGNVTAIDVDLLAMGIANGGDTRFDVNQDGTVDLEDRRHLIEVTLGSLYGDSNLDGVFDSTDLVSTFQRARYEDFDGEEVGWQDGDWNGDGRFTSADLVLAMQGGNYRQE